MRDSHDRTREGLFGSAASGKKRPHSTACMKRKGVDLFIMMMIMEVDVIKSKDFQIRTGPSR